MRVQPWNEVGDGASLMDRIDGRVPFEVRMRAWNQVKADRGGGPVSFRIHYCNRPRLSVVSVRPWVRRAVSIAERVAGAPPGSVLSENKDRFKVVPARLAVIHAMRLQWPSLPLSSMGRIMDRNHSTICHALDKDPVARGFDHIINAIMQEIGHDGEKMRSMVRGQHERAAQTCHCGRREL